MQKETPKLPSVSFNIGVPDYSAFDALYICGDIDALGNWNPEKALKIKKTKSGSFLKTIRLPLGMRFQFKILGAQSWASVEKGRFFEELPDREFRVTAQKNRVIAEVKTLSAADSDA